MKIEDLMLHIYKFKCINIDQQIDFILVSESNYIRLKREIVSLIRYSFFEEAEIMKRPTMKINGIDISFHELIKDNRISIESHKI